MNLRKRSARVSPLLCACLLIGGCASGPATRPNTGTYRLPYTAGRAYLVVQAGPGPMSHSGTQKYAIDFEMPKGTPVLAARAGVVTGVKEDSDKGGMSEDNAEDGNYVRVRHDDRTVAIYLHLQKNGADVSVGERVACGQPLGRSGSTGWSAMPHLHFQVDRVDPATGTWTSIPIAFAEVEGNGVPGFLARPISKNMGSKNMTR